MKRLSLSVILALMTLSASSQTVTNDTLICLPKSTMQKVTEDLVRGDQCADEQKVNIDIISDQKKSIAYLDSVRKECVKQDSIHIGNMKTCKQEVSAKDGIITNLSIKIGNKNKELWIMRGVAVILGGLIYVTNR